MKKQRRKAELDRIIGANIRKRRRDLNLNQKVLAAVLGISYQQVQKFEQGTNRTSAVQLHTLSQLLKVPMEWFFEE